MDLPIACTLSDAAKRERRQSIEELFRGPEMTVSGLPNGYAYTFASAAGQNWMQIAQLVDLQRECCPFLSFRIVVDSERALLRLEITGPAQVKSLIEDFFGSSQKPLTNGAGLSRNGFYGDKLQKRCNIRLMTLDVETIRQAQKLIKSCEQCESALAQVPFDYVLDKITGCDPSATEYVLSEPAECPRCKVAVFEGTLVAIHHGGDGSGDSDDYSNPNMSLVLMK